MVPKKPTRLITALGKRETCFLKRMSGMGGREETKVAASEGREERLEREEESREEEEVYRGERSGFSGSWTWRRADDVR